MSECKHGMREAWCALCTGLPSPPIIVTGLTIAARLSGKCPGCGERIEEGDDIVLAEVDGSGEWVCGSRCGRA